MALAPFHPTIRAWFERELGAPTAPQVRAWPRIRAGEHVLIAAPTGSGKTLAAFLSALDALFAEGAALPHETRVLYVSPLRALSNDVQKNLAAPLARLRELDPTLPEVRVLVRTGDTPAKERASMLRAPPHVLVTTPESLAILLTSEGGRRLLANVRTAIVDEIHALIGDKRGAHLALSLERLDALVASREREERGLLERNDGAPATRRAVQRIGLSATQKPIEDVARFLGGAGRDVAIVDEGHLRALDVEVELPPSPLETVCSHETWSEIYARVVELSRAHRTTLVFAGTRKLAERASAELGKLLGADVVGCHHSSLSKERRLAAEQRLKQGELRVLVATASLELGIDIGDVDLVVQLGATRTIATFLQRVGRAGHGVGRVPKGRVFPLTRDELAEVAALLRAVKRGELDRLRMPRGPLDILAQQIVAECACTPWDADALFAAFTRAAPYRELARERFDALVALHAEDRRALLHRAVVPDEHGALHTRLRGTRRARLVAITSGGAIPDTTQYQVVVEPEGTLVGAVDEDFAIESSAGDVFQLGATSWRILRLERGTLRVADAHGVPPSLPFWFGEAPARSRELSASFSEVREHGRDRAWLERECSLPPAAADALATYLEEAHAALGALPTAHRIVIERFFDESGGSQLVLHAPFGSKVNRAFGLALRKRFCRHFGFELQAAANEDALLLSLSPQHSFPLEEVFDYLRAKTVRSVVVQALLATPMFGTRWRWNTTRALLLERTSGGKRVPPPILRMRADDLLARAFPDVVACGENLPPGDLDVPEEHPMVGQTVHDCLHEAMDLDGLVAVLEGLESGRIERVVRDVSEPSPLARSILAARPYAFLDDAPLEERRTQAVYARRTSDARGASALGELDPAAIESVCAEAWPDPRDAEELHEALLWMGWLRDDELERFARGDDDERERVAGRVATANEDGARGDDANGAPEERDSALGPAEIARWLEALRAQGRVEHAHGAWLARESTRDPRAMLRGRMEALGPIAHDDPRVDAFAVLGKSATTHDREALFAELEREGCVMRTLVGGRSTWCDRRLLARIRGRTLERLRRAIAPVSTAEWLHFLARWQHLDLETRVEGPGGVLALVRQLAGVEAQAAAWEKRLFAPRVREYRPEWLDELCLTGRVAWGRLWSSGKTAPRATPIALVPREELDTWLALAPPADVSALSWPARAVLDVLQARGALFQDDLARASKLLPSDVERGLIELVGLGAITNDSFASLRALLKPSDQRRIPLVGGGRWSLLRATESRSVHDAHGDALFGARVLLRRYGVVFRTAVADERWPLPWRDLVRVLRELELAGDVRGGRFVAGHSGEQYALPEAIPLLRAARRAEDRTDESSSLVRRSSVTSADDDA
ncbi:MAG: DEAD/DEAH box helicase [Planctomycetota bacterium]